MCDLEISFKKMPKASFLVIKYSSDLKNDEGDKAKDNVEISQQFIKELFLKTECLLDDVKIDKDNDRIKYYFDLEKCGEFFDYNEPEIKDVRHLKLRHDVETHWLTHSETCYDIAYSDEDECFYEDFQYKLSCVENRLEFKGYCWLYTITCNLKPIKKLLKHHKLRSKVFPGQHKIISYNDQLYRVTNQPVVKHNNRDRSIEQVFTSAMDKQTMEDENEDEIGKVVIRMDYDNVISRQLNLQLYVVYDLETIIIQGKHHPFMMYAQIFNPGQDDIVEQIKFTCTTFEQCESLSCMEYLLNSIEDYILTKCKVKNGIKFCYLIGYNNYKFDDSFLRRYAVTRYSDLEYSERKNTSNATVLKLPNCGTYIKTFDVMKWCPGMSLSNAAKSYKLASEKVQFNVVKFTQYLIYEHSSDLNLDEVYVSEEKLNSFFTDTPDTWRLNSWKVDDERYDAMKACEYYCHYDVYVTLLLFNKIYVSIKDIVDKWNDQFTSIENDKINNNFIYLNTPSTTAMELQMKIIRYYGYEFYRVNDTTYKTMIDESYYGGRTDFSHLGLIERPIIYYDVCGMYSLAMKANYPSSLPLSLALMRCYEEDERQEISNKINRLYLLWSKTIRDIRETRKHASLDQSELFKFFDNNGAVLMCNIKPPSEELQLPSSPIGKKSADKSSTTYANVERKNIILTSVHIRTLLYCHYDVEILDYRSNIYYEKMAPILSKYNEILTKKKTEYQLQQNTSGRSLIKLFLNSLYGKLAQNTFAKILRFEQTETKEDEEDTFTPIVEQENKNSYLYLGAFVTAYSNHVLIDSLYQICYPYLVSGEIYKKRQAWYYCDTDSLIIDAEYGYNFNPTLGNECGTYDFENSKFNSIWEKDEYDQMAIFGKKSYTLIRKNELVDKKFKGLPSSALETFDYNALKSLFTPISKLFTAKNVVVMKDRLIKKRKRRGHTVEILVDYIQETLSRTMRVNNKLYALLDAKNKDKNCVIVDKYDLYNDDVNIKQLKFDEDKFYAFMKTGKCSTCEQIIDTTIFSLKTFQCYKCENLK